MNKSISSADIGLTISMISILSIVSIIYSSNPSSIISSPSKMQAEKFHFIISLDVI
jgi:hypothetical protein